MNKILSRIVLSVVLFTGVASAACVPEPTDTSTAEADTTVGIGTSPFAPDITAWYKLLARVADLEDEVEDMKIDIASAYIEMSLLEARIEWLESQP